MAEKSDKKSGTGLSKPSNAERSVAEGNLNMLFSFATAIGKWQSTLTTERRKHIRNLFTVPRNDPNDPFKPNSATQVQIIGQQPLKKPLDEKELEMLDAIGASYDYSLPLDIINWPYSMPNLSDDCRVQLERIPTWLKALILLRFDKIQQYFGDRTHLFLRMLANWIDYQRSIPIKLLEMEDNDDEEDCYIINKNFLVETEEIDAALDKSRAVRKSFKGADLFRIARAVALWRLPRSVRFEWSPTQIHRTAQTFRKAMVTQASPAEIAMMAAEDEAIDALNYDSDEDDLYKRASWREILCEKPEFKEEIAKAVEEDFETIPHHFRWMEEKVAPKIAKIRARKKKQQEREKQKKNIDASKVRWYKRNRLFADKRKVHSRNVEDLIKRGLHRRYSRIWYKDCPMKEM